MSLKKIKWQDYVLVGIVIFAFCLNFWALSKEGYSNEYYAAAVKSMLSNAKAFFYGSFDSGLYVTVDKPPLGLWLQALSSMVFGLNSFGLIFPSAFAGSMCAMLVYSMVKKVWGDAIGLIGAGIVATTPILVALSRTNNMDMILLFFLLCGAIFILKAAKNQSLKYYLIAMVFLGLGFNVKMLQAFMVLPAFLLIYFMGKGKLIKKIWHTSIAICVLAVISLSWLVIVDSIPESERPYIGSSSTNSVFDLVMGYNGLSRLTGQQDGMRGSSLSIDGDSTDGRIYSEDGSVPKQVGDSSYFGIIASDNSEFSGNKPSGEAPTDIAQKGETPTDLTQGDGKTEGAPQIDGTQDGRNNIGTNIGNGGGAGSESESGTKGVLRLYTAQLAGLISWFLLPAIGMIVLAGVCCVYWFIKRKSIVLTDERRDKINNIVFWCAWLMPMAVFFSIGGFIHRYYVVMLCPAIAALAAIAATLIWESKHKKWLVPLCFIATFAVQAFIVSRTSWLWILIPMLTCAVLGLVLLLLKKKVFQVVSAALMLSALFIAPMAWSLTPVLYTTNSTIPNAGPDLASSGGGGISMPQSSNSIASDSSSVLYDYLLANYNGERWAVAVSSSNDAAPIILETGLSVMSIGGFSGNDSILTLDTLKQYVASGELRYYMASSRNGGSSEISTWVQENGTAVELSNGDTLYDLSQAK